MSDCHLEARGISFSYRRFRPHRVFTDFTWTVPAGRTTLLLGPNGAGKSTLLRLLCGFDTPDAGRVSFAGDSSRRALFENVGWMPQHVQAARGLTVLEQVGYAAWVGGASSRMARVAARDAVARVDLEGQADVRADRLSGGQLRRVGLAQALVRRAPVLLLDEPTAGLDPAQAMNFRRILADLDCPGGIVISTHQADELAEQVDAVTVLANGTLVFDGTADQLRSLRPRHDGTPMTLTESFASLVGGGRH